MIWLLRILYGIANYKLLLSVKRGSLNRKIKLSKCHYTKEIFQEGGNFDVFLKSVFMIFLKLDVNNRNWIKVTFGKKGGWIFSKMSFF